MKENFLQGNSKSPKPIEKSTPNEEGKEFWNKIWGNKKNDKRNDYGH